MENPSTDVSEVSSTSTPEISSSTDNALAGKSFKDAAMEYADTKESEREKLDNGKSKLNAKSGDEVSDDNEDGSQRPKEAESKESPGVKKRIDGLTAKYNKEREAHKTVSLENARLKEAVRLYGEEIERISKYAKLDPQAERVRELELQREVDQIEGRIPGEIEGRFGEAERESAHQEKISEIADQIRTVTSEYEGLFSARELALYMKQTQSRDPAAAAKMLGDSRIQAVQSRTKAPPAPMTASGRAAGSREPAQPWRYKGTASIEDFMEQRERERKGR